jgi:imidazole glycerol-phosphate synthase subunit HisH
MKIGIVNYGMGNIASVQNALAHVGAETVVLEDAAGFSQVDKLVLPGVGAFPMAMQQLKELNLLESLNRFVLSEGKPAIGLCLGMQLLFDSSEEFGSTQGLGWISGTVMTLDPSAIGLPVPHMGWNDLQVVNDSPLLAGIAATERDVYFVHSFYCRAADRNDVTATVSYGVEMDVMIRKGNLFGCQFHPEKSQKTGLRILRNFCEL